MYRLSGAPPVLLAPDGSGLEVWDLAWGFDVIPSCPPVLVLGDVRSSLSLAGISPEGRTGDVSRVGIWLGTPNGYAAVVHAMACPLGLQNMVVHSGPVPHLCCSFHKKSEGGLCLARLAADHTVAWDRALSLVLGGNLKTVTGRPATFCCIMCPPTSSSLKAEVLKRRT